MQHYCLQVWLIDESRVDEPVVHQVTHIVEEFQASWIIDLEDALPCLRIGHQVVKESGPAEDFKGSSKVGSDGGHGDVVESAESIQLACNWGFYFSLFSLLYSSNISLALVKEFSGSQELSEEG